MEVRRYKFIGLIAEINIGVPILFNRYSIGATSGNGSPTTHQVWHRDYFTIDLIELELLIKKQNVQIGLGRII